MDAPKLLGSYKTPVHEKGDLIMCHIKGLSPVWGNTNAPIPWPRHKKNGKASLILTDDLAEAVKRQKGKTMTRKKSEETQKKDAERSIAYDKNNPEAKKSRANAYTERKRLELQGLKQEILDLKKENQELREKVEEYEKRLLT